MEKKYYKAVFEVPAMVRIELLLDAENQQEGLISAHDLIHQASVTDAQVQTLLLDQAQNVSFERVEATAAPASLLGATALYRVELFENDFEHSTPVRVQAGLPYGAAQQLAESVLAEDSVYGTSRVIEEATQLEVLRCRSMRGGFEVQAYTAQAPGVAAPLPDQCATWLASRASANRVAMQLLERADVVRVCILDYTSRSQGARVVRVIE